MNVILDLEAARDLIINNVCKPCAEQPQSKRCDCCMDFYALAALEADINEVADAEADRKGF